jgi:hypothetical protein
VSELAGSNPTAGGTGSPDGVLVSEIHPNPFGFTSAFTLELDQGQHVRITVYDLLGRSVRQLQQGPLDGGRVHRFTIESAGLASGLYLIRIEGEHFTELRRVTLSR